MKKRTNIINYIITMLITLGTLFFVVYLSSERYGETMFNALLKILVGAVVAGLVTTFVHELGHFLMGKKNNFAFSSMAVWFFKWAKSGKEINFSFVMIGDSAGYTEMVPKSSENIEKRLVSMTNGGIWATFIVMLLGIPPLFISTLPVWLFSIWAMFLPIGAYYFFNSLLPTSSGGMFNDGGVVYSIKKGLAEGKVIVNLHKIQGEMYSGKTPSEIDGNLFFDVPQLPEDSPYFIMLLNYRYMYYLDKEDFDNAKKTTDRLLSLSDYMPKSVYREICVDALYNSCTFDFDSEKADNYVADLEKYLNNVNNCNNVRAKMAYLFYVVKDREAMVTFYKKALREANRCILKGQGNYEKRLIERINSDIKTETVSQ